METADATAGSVAELALLKQKLRCDEETARSLILQFLAVRHDINITRSNIDRCEKVLRKSYISIIPSDVLALIFSDATDPCNVSWLLHLSHVCRWWREVTISTPGLWAKNLRISDGWAGGLFDLYLERAKQCPLEIQFEGGKFDHKQKTEDGDDPYYTEETLETLLSCMARCRKLELSIGVSPLSSRCLACLADISAPCLEALVVKASADASRYWQDPIQILKGGAPVLSSLVLEKIRPSLLGIGDGSNGLTSLLVRDQRQPNLYRKPLPMSWLTLLTTLRLDIPSPHYQDGKLAPVELTHLLFLEASLCLYADPTNSTKSQVRYTGTILPSIKAPRLEHLQAVLCNHDYSAKIRGDPPAFPMLQKLTIQFHPRVDGHKALPGLP